MANDDDGSGYGLADYDGGPGLTEDMIRRALFDCERVQIGELVYRYDYNSREIRAKPPGDEPETTMTFDEFITEELASFTDVDLEKARVL